MRWWICSLDIAYLNVTTKKYASHNHRLVDGNAGTVSRDGPVQEGRAAGETGRPRGARRGRQMRGGKSVSLAEPVRRI